MLGNGQGGDGQDRDAQQHHPDGGKDGDHSPLELEESEPQALESIVIAVLGAVLGVVMGIGFGVARMHAQREEGLEVIDVPTGQLAMFLLVSLLIGVLAAVLPARRAARLDVLEAISTE